MKNCLKIAATVLILVFAVAQTPSYAYMPGPEDGSTLCIEETECATIVDCSGAGTHCIKSESGTYPKAGMCPIT